MKASAATPVACTDCFDMQGPVVLAVARNGGQQEDGSASDGCLSTKLVGCSNLGWTSFLLALLQRLFPSLLLCNGSGEEYEKTERTKEQEEKREERRKGSRACQLVRFGHGSSKLVFGRCPKSLQGIRNRRPVT